MLRRVCLILALPVAVDADVIPALVRRGAPEAKEKERGGGASTGAQDRGAGLRHI